MTLLHLIDWNKEIVHGWEFDMNTTVIDAIVQGIEAGDRFPAVSVYQSSQGQFYLDPHQKIDIQRDNKRITGLDGGHHRAVGHYLACQPFLVRIVHQGQPLQKGYGYFPIQHSELIDDNDVPNGSKFKDRQKFFPAYRQPSNFSSQL